MPPWYFSLIFKPPQSHLHPLQVENCDSNSRLVVDEDDNVKSGLKGLRKRPARDTKLCIVCFYLILVLSVNTMYINFIVDVELS